MHYPKLINANPLNRKTRRDAPERALVESIVLTSEVCGNALSHAAAEMLAGDISDFGSEAILTALARCRMELHGPLKASDIIVRINDSRPGVDEAWAMTPKNELTSVVWTEEMARAWGLAAPLLEANDLNGARQAFCKGYTEAVLQARIRREPVRWTPSLGSDPAGRKDVLLDAVRKGRLSAEQAEQLLPRVEAAVAADEAAARVDIRNLH